MADIAPEISIAQIPIKKSKEVVSDPNLRERLINELRSEMQLPPPPEPSVLVDLAANSTKQAILGGGIADIFMNLKRRSTQSFFVAAATVLGRTDIPRMPEEIRKTLESSQTPWERYRSFFLNGNQDVLYSASDEELEEWRRKSRFYQMSFVKELPQDPKEIQNAVFQVFREKNDDGSENEKAIEWNIPGRDRKHTYELDINKPEDVQVIDIYDPSILKRFSNPRFLDDPRFQNKLIVIRRHSGEWNGDWEKEVLSKLLDTNKGVIYMVDADERRGTGPYIQSIWNHNWGDAMQFDHAQTRLGQEFFGSRKADDLETHKVSQQCNRRFNFGKNNANGAVHTFELGGRKKALINELYLNYATKIDGLVNDYNQQNPNHKKDVFLKDATFLQLLLLDVTGGKGGILKFDNTKKLDHFEVNGSLKELEEAIGNKNLDAIEVILKIDNPANSTMSLIGEADTQLRTPEEKYKMALATWRSGASKGISGTTMLSVLRDSETIGCPAAPPFMETVQTANVKMSKDKHQGKFRIFDQIVLNIKANWQKKV